MTAVLALLPCAAVVAAVLALRWSGLAAACLALAVSGGLWLSGVFAPGPFGGADLRAIPHALADGAVLTGLMASVIVPGLLFVEICRRAGSLQAVERVIAAMRLDPARAVVVIAMGVGVALESLTGFGVSMLVTVPLLLTAVSRDRAIPLALAGMSLMPWGALSIAALLGAELAGIPVATLAASVIGTSGPVAFVLPLVCLLFVPNAGGGAVVFALASGAALTAGIAVTSYAVGVEIAGVGGGLAVLVLAVLVCPDKRRLAAALATPSLGLLGLLIAGVIVQKVLVTWLAGIGIAPVVSTGRVSLAVLSSPGFALLASGLMGLVLWPRVFRGSEGEMPLLRFTAVRAWRAILTILVFLVMARLLVETGGIGALADMLASVGAYASVAAVSALAGVGAYATGSGVPSAALFMTSAAATGESFGQLALFAALQHSAAGHTAMASLPVISILLAALPARQREDERVALRWGLMLAAAWMAMVIASGWIHLILA